jgi:RNase P subunit RPR2
MARKINDLLTQLAVTDVNSSEFIALSKQIAQVHRENIQKKNDNKSKEPKPKKEKTILCTNCSKLLIPKINDLNALIKKEEVKQNE